MAHREPKKILPTMKIEPEGETDIQAVETQATLKDLRDVPTKKYGIKVVATLVNDKYGEFQVFVNNYSMERLCEKWGNDDTAWKGKLVDLKIEKDATYDADMIVIHPVA